MNQKNNMQLKILQWNVWYKEDPQKILQLLRETTWDVCCLQEIDVSNSLDVSKFLKKELGAEGHYVTAQDWDDKPRGYAAQGNMILSRVSFTDATHCFVQDYNKEKTTDFTKEGRVAVSITLETPQPLQIVTVHLSYNHKFHETEQKLKEEEQLLSYLKTIKKPFVLTGDFNITPKSHLIEELSKSYQHLGPDYSEPTWTTKPFSYNGFEEDKLNWRLDYAFGSKDINVISAEVVSTDVSDHLPLLVTIEV